MKEKPEGVWFGDWCVVPNGDIVCYKQDGIGEYYEEYYITTNMLGLTDWITHMSKKRWCDMSDFSRAFNHAVATSGGAV